MKAMAVTAGQPEVVATVSGVAAQATDVAHERATLSQSINRG